MADDDQKFRYEGEEADVDRLIELGEMIKDSSLCGLGQTAPNPVLSTLQYFGHEYEDLLVDDPLEVSDA